MSKELLGMSNEELIQWACKNSALEEKEIKKIFPAIEAYCATHTIGIYHFIEQLVEMSNAGIKAAKAGRLLRKYYESNNR